MYKLGYKKNASSFIQGASYWDILKDHIHKTTSKIIETLFNFKDKVIKWPTKNEKKKKSIIIIFEKDLLYEKSK